MLCASSDVKSRVTGQIPGDEGSGFQMASQRGVLVPHHLNVERQTWDNKAKEKRAWVNPSLLPSRGISSSRPSLPAHGLLDADVGIVQED